MSLTEDLADKLAADTLAATWRGPATTGRALEVGKAIGAVALDAGSVSQLVPADAGRRARTPVPRRADGAGDGARSRTGQRA